MIAKAKLLATTAAAPEPPDAAASEATRQQRDSAARVAEERQRSKQLALIYRVYVLRHELLVMVPFSMATVDRLEARGVFPQRVRLAPTKRVAWVRREVEAFLRLYAKRRPHQSDTHAAKEDETKT